MSQITVESIFNQLGGAAKAARALGVARTTALGWRKAGKIPAARAFDLAQLSGRPVSDLAALVTKRSQREVRP